MTARRRSLVLGALMAVVAVGAVSALAAGAVTWPTQQQEIAKAGKFNLPFCGTKPITLAVLDGFGINAWSQESYAAVRSEAAKCPNVKVITAAGGGDLQKSISDISSSVAQGAKAITVIPDFGAAELPAIQQATAQGVKVVPWGADAGGKPGTDFVAYVDWNDGYAGTLWANWMVKALHGKGNVIYTGGPAGNPVGAAQLAAVVAVFKKHPGMKLLTGNKDWPVTNWDPATAQKVTAALLAKFPKIDGIISNYGTDAFASIRAFQAAGRKLVPVTTLDANGLSCMYRKNGLPLSTISSRNWLGRVAARKAIAAAEGLPNNEVSKYNLTLFEDTLTPGKALRCNPKAASDFYPSNQLTVSTIAKYGKP
jgi:ribose transport system substrate-binding protein